jgi:NADH-ubiquinone oxidoreductase chain 5
MLFIILLISLFVQIFSYSYLANDPHIVRFYLYLNLFTYQMLLLVTGDNFFSLFLGWEGVGLVSYLLINFWFTRIEANLASLKAFFMNRIGDYGLIVAIILWYITYGDTIIHVLGDINPNLIFFIGIFFFLGAIAKSAQIGLHSWLTSAMEGPTPVSALLHAATMVTAGIYLLMRLSIFIEWSDDLLLIISWFGGLSALTGAIGGLLDYDIKKIIAYSTISQLGYMVISSAFSLYNITLWHLINHALFKALLFLSAGAIIHSIYDIQDLRKYGAFKLYLPHLYNYVLIGNLSLIAFPFFTGFYSKDLILELIFSSNSNFLFFLIYITAILTASYSIKLIIMTFLSRPNFSYHSAPITNSLTLSFIVPLSLLSIGAVIFGD